MRRPINGDGFGVGYFPQDKESDVEDGPCVFCSTTPAWNNLNLERLASHTKSKMVFAHVRASTSGVLSETNCHPFVYHSFMFMHNGNISGFNHIKRKMGIHIKEEYFLMIQGATDSEWTFALFLDTVDKLGYDPKRGSIPAKVMRQALEITLAYIKDWTKEALGPAILESEPSLMNCAVTDGETVVVSRYVTSKTLEAASLYFSSGTKFYEYEPGQYKMERRDRGQNIIMVASEPLTFERNDWISIPTNTILTIKGQTIMLHPLLDEYYQEDPTQPRSSDFAEKKGFVSPMVVNKPNEGVPPLEREGRRVAKDEVVSIPSPGIGPVLVN